MKICEKKYTGMWTYKTEKMGAAMPSEKGNGGKKMFMLPIIDMVRTGENITRLRRNAGLSVRELQEIFGFATPQAIYKWQHGTALPTIDNLAVLAVVFQVHMEDFLVFQDLSCERTSA